MILVAQRTFAVLTLLAVAITIAVVGALITRRVPPWLRDDVALPLAAAIAAVATGGSLFLSEVAGYVPCELCWYQRIAMYPLVVIVTVAAWRSDPEVWRTVAPIASVGAAVSVWHIAVERIPSLAGACDQAAPCALRWVEEFGFLTLPMMALTAFLAVLVLTLAARNAR